MCVCVAEVQYVPRFQSKTGGEKKTTQRVTQPAKPGLRRIVRFLCLSLCKQPDPRGACPLEPERRMLWVDVVAARCSCTLDGQGLEDVVDALRLEHDLGPVAPRLLREL